MSFPPEFYALVTAFWTVYQPIVMVFAFTIVAAAALIGVILVAALALRPLFNR